MQKSPTKDAKSNFGIKTFLDDLEQNKNTALFKQTNKSKTKANSKKTSSLERKINLMTLSRLVIQ